MLKHLSRAQRAVAIWIFIGIGMLQVQVILGGITRLTGSGLSITEWKVLEGAFPPLTTHQWQTAFEKYRQTPQYLLLNSDFTLSRYKFIYFWEWFHREWARLIGVVFIIGFIYLIIKRYLAASLIKPLLILFLLGALQGRIGWIMVKSGLTDDMIYVKPLKLALHFVFALGLVCYVWWVALQLSVPKHQLTPNTRLSTLTWCIIILLFFQLGYGALMAGSRAAAAAPTWPGINGQWLPLHAFSSATNLLENAVTIHFIHRNLAFALVVLVLAWTVLAIKTQGASMAWKQTKWLPLLFILLQAALGILTVYSSPYITPNNWVTFDWIAEWHQITGMLFLLVMIWMLFLLKAKTPAG